ncbi:MAG TPA: tetratricopeptide repeat protein, partial [Candidatus Acidoferrales bacterium]|nr:tetratricopeptide repeat protein [Candidatus Acidoferrales bacterium]
DPKDQATLMTVGDLFARQGDMTQAIEYFERLAQVYLNDGFNSKAIAIYKKIAKLAPNELAPLERLADLYVQQGVLSEARPLFLQIAEAHLKANHSQKAVEVLHRLLEVEPENQRVQMRLAELYGMMGQKKEAALTYQAYAHRLFDRGETEEAEKLVERALEVDPGNAAAILLKAKTLNAAEKTDQAIAILSTHPEAETEGDVTKLLVEYELRAGHADRAADRARRQLARGHAHYGLLCKVVENMIEGAQPEQALPLLTELRAPMIEAGAQDHYLKSLTTACERLPGRTEPLEALADFCRTTSDPFRLNAALGQLSDAYAAQGNMPRAEELLVELVDRNKNDERLVDRLNQLRARTGGAPIAGGTSADSAAAGPASQTGLRESAAEEQNKLVSPPPPTIAEEALDEETHKYIAQALTDVDLFSSYGLTQKATHLLENVLQRAPRHTATLERLLDLHLGAGNDRRTAELAAQLEQIHRERNDTVNADRFAELRQRYSKVAGLTEKDLPVAPAATAPAPVASSAGAGTTVPEQASAAAPAEPPAFEVAPETVPAAAASAPIEFEIPLDGLEPEATPPPEPISLAPEEVAAASATQEAVAPQIAGIGEELDLSDEWEAIAAETTETADAPAANEIEAASVELDPVVEPEPVAAEASEATDTTAALEAVFDVSALADEEPDQDAKPEPFQIEANTPQSEMTAHVPEVEPEVPAEAAATEPEIELIEVGEEEAPTAEAIPEAVLELVDEPIAAETATASGTGAADFELELTPETAAPREHAGAATTEDFISELVAELDDLEAPSAEPVQESAIASGSVAVPKDTHASLEQVFAEANATPMAAITPPPTNGSTHKNLAPAATPGTLENLNQLAEVFQEFRSELGEMGEEDEDLETHYNLGIAYREMGLLDEAIGEFQKVAKAVQKGKPFRYEMNCSVMLGLSFMDKGEPKVASLWYRRALQVPGLEEESALALRYDLGLALESAGEADAALDSFRQVYAANIDYRDVADRIATLQKH